MLLLFFLVVFGTLLAGCDTFLQEDDAVEIPTRVSIDQQAFQTAVVFTLNAPPSGFESVAFPEISDNLITTVYSSVDINVFFDGHYSDTQEPVEAGYMRVQIWNDELHVARHVRIEFLGDVFSGGSSNLDVVRLSNDYYMVDTSGRCITDPATVSEIANLRPGQLIGGVEFAQPSGRKEVINGVQAWQYGFDPQFINPPAVELSNGTADLDFLTGELWVDPEHNVVVRYAVELNVHRAKLLFGDREVTGRLRYQYDVFDIGVQPQISLPRGC